MRKIVFLDIDGVLNSKETLKRCGGGILGIDPYLVSIFNHIILETDAEIVISSSWRHSPRGMEDIKKALVHPILDKTPKCCAGIRGVEIYQWINKNIDYDKRDDLKYAILDDDSDMLLWQKDSFFQTTFDKGITKEIVQKVIKHLNATL